MITLPTVFTGGFPAIGNLLRTNVVPFFDEVVDSLGCFAPKNFPGYQPSLSSFGVLVDEEDCCTGAEEEADEDSDDTEPMEPFREGTLSSTELLIGVEEILVLTGLGLSAVMDTLATSELLFVKAAGT